MSDLSEKPKTAAPRKEYKLLESLRQRGKLLDPKVDKTVKLTEKQFERLSKEGIVDNK